MTRHALRSLLMRAARLLEQPKQPPPARRIALARELKAAAEKGIRT